MKKAALVLAVLAVTACGTQREQSTSSVEDTTSGKKAVTIEGADAKALMGAMNESGLIQIERVYGTFTLKATNIRCSQLIHGTPDRKDPSCRLTGVTEHGRKTFSVSGKPGQAFMTVLGNAGLFVNGGINATAVAAKKIQCSQVVVADPEPVCVVEI